MPDRQALTDEPSRASQIHVALQGLSYGYVTVFAEA